PISGGCLCAAVRYMCASPPVMTLVCHCTNCQKQSGSAFSVNVAVATGDLRLTAGEPTVYEDRGESGQPVYRHFCGACGSPIFSSVAAMPDLLFLKAGTLDDTSGVKPALDVWCKSAQPWVPHPAGVPQFPENPPLG
ncbi:MAG: GFA family protein, partial [Caulobacter sp.]|nr:GFA family protein [Caulobacter sp.]